MVALENVSKRYGGRAAVHPLTLRFAASSATALIGASGCGKSTLLRMIVGLVQPDTGHVSVCGERLTPESANRLRHRIGYVIQEGGLFPHLTARENVTLLARHLRRAPDWIDARVRTLTGLVALPPDALDRYPQALSGGQRQRIGLMRALMLDPDVLLLDEPLGALDPITRFTLQRELKAIFESLRKTVVLVTHDIAEAAYLAGDIAVLREGRLVQRASYATLASAPADPYVAEFLSAQRAPAA